MATSRPRAVVVGAGLGGLFSAAYLAADGFDVDVYEKLLFFGGKFTSLDHDGFQIPTGALHTLPGGRHGAIARACAELGVPLELHQARPGFAVRRGEQRYAVSKNPFKAGTFLAQLSPLDRLRTALAILGLACAPALPDLSLGEWLRRARVPDEVRQLFDRATAFSIGVGADEASARDIGYGLWRQNWRTEAVIRGGARALADGLVAVIRAGGGRLHKGRAAERLLAEGGRVSGVRMARGEVEEADLVVSCVGAARTAELLGDACPGSLSALVARARPACGAVYSVRSRRALTPSAGIEVPLDAKHISGYLQVTQAAPELAPPGWHYLLAFQVLDQEAQLAPQLEAGGAELATLFAGRGADLFHTSVYRGDWPAARLGQAVRQAGERRCPLHDAALSNLYLVSHDATGYGFAAEIIPAAARRMRDGVRRDREAARSVADA